jgi:glucose-1-phosphate thymidylyltransferase
MIPISLQRSKERGPWRGRVRGDTDCYCFTSYSSVHLKSISDRNFTINPCGLCMRAIIPVAGVGSRLRPHTYMLPKVLLNVAGKPILAHILDKIIAEGITEATFVVGHMSDKIMEYVSQAYPSFKADFVEQEERLGLGHAIYLSRHTLGSEPVLIILGDTIFDVDLGPVLASTVSSLGVKEVEDPRRFGVAEMRDGRITRLIEKPETPVSRLAIVGLYYLRNTRLLVAALNELVEKDIRTKGEYQLTDALQIMLQRGEEMTTFPVQGWFDCGKPETLLSTNRALLEKQSVSRVIPGVVVIEPVYIAASARLRDCVVGPYTTVGDNVEISESVIRNSIIGEEAVVQKALLDNSIVGNGSVVKGGYKRINVGGSSEIDFY